MTNIAYIVEDAWGGQLITSQGSALLTLALQPGGPVKVVAVMPVLYSQVGHSQF